MSWFIKKKQEPEERSVFGDYLMYNCTGNYGTTKAMLLSAVYRCVEVISDSIAQLPCEPFKIDSNGYKHLLNEHPTYQLLNKQPNSSMSRFTFMKIMAVSMLLKGNAYAYIERDSNGNAVNLYYVPSDSVTIIKPKYVNQPIYYSVVGFKDVIEDCNMIHILNFTTDGIEGISTLANAKNTLSLSMDSEAHAAGFFKGGANAAGILKSTSPLTTKQKENLKTSWNSAFNAQSGTPNGVAVLDADLDFQAITINPSDAQLLETREFNVVDICRFFGVSPVKAFDLSKSSYSTVEATELSFLTDTLAPLLEKFEQEFERKLYKPSDGNIDVRYNTSALLRADKQSLATYYSTLFNIGAISPNEIRRDLDLPPVDNGDTTFVQVNIQTLDKAVKQIDEVNNDNTEGE